MTYPTYPMTNAELAAAIEWAHTRLELPPKSTIAMDERLIFNHLSELLKIQRERAALAPVAKKDLWDDPPQI
jgi:hypothetical protein